MPTGRSASSQAHDPDYLEWLARAPAGLTFRKEIYTELARRPAAVSGRRPRRHGRHRPDRGSAAPALVGRSSSGEGAGPPSRPQILEQFLRNRRSRVLALRARHPVRDGTAIRRRLRLPEGPGRRIRLEAPLLVIAERRRRPLVGVDRRPLFGPCFERPSVRPGRMRPSSISSWRASCSRHSRCFLAAGRSAERGALRRGDSAPRRSSRRTAPRRRPAAR